MNGINQLTNVQNTQLRFQVAFPIGFKLSMVNRLEYHSFQKSRLKHENGHLLFTEINYKASQKLNFNARVAYFNTDSYNARVYLSEKDVLYQNNLQMLQNQGFRLYFNAKHMLARNIDVWLRLSNSFYLDQKTVGSLNDEISGPNKTEARFQIRVKF